MLTNRATNEELRRSFTDLSLPIVFAIEEAANPDYKVLYLAQEIRDTENMNTITEVQKRLLGWKSDVKIVRCVQTITTGIAEGLSIDFGYQFKDFNINITTSIEPAYPGQLPMMKGEDVVLQGGRLVFEHANLVYGTHVPHSFIENIKTTTHIYKYDERVSNVAGATANAPGAVEVVKEEIAKHPDESEMRGDTIEDNLTKAVIEEIIEETKHEEPAPQEMEQLYEPVAISLEKQEPVVYSLLD